MNDPTSPQHQLTTQGRPGAGTPDRLTTRSSTSSWPLHTVTTPPDRPPVVNPHAVCQHQTARVGASPGTWGHVVDDVMTDLTPRYRVHVLARDWVWHKDTVEDVARLLQHIGDYRGQTNIIDLSTWDCVPWEHFEWAVSA